MWRLLPVILLVGCATDSQQDSAGADAPEATHRVVRVLDLPLEDALQPGGGQGLTKTFRQGDTRGWIAEDGSWEINSAVAHNRLRCGTYEVGIQLGQGTPACSDVRWLTAVQYATRQTHCNSAVLVHRGGATLPASQDDVAASTCARIVTRCSGTC